MQYVKINSRRYYILSFAIIIVIGLIAYVFVRLRSNADEIVTQPHLPAVQYINSTQ
jgi:hypothetical protein